MNKISQDLLIIEAILAPTLLKKADEGSIIGSLINTVKNYVASHIDQNRKFESIVDILTPAIFAGLGFPILSVIIEVAESYLGLSPGNMLMSVVDKVKSAISSGNKVSPEQVDQWSEQSVAQNPGKELTQQDVDKIENIKNADVSLIEAKLIKAALLELQESNSKVDYSRVKRATILSSFLSLLGLKRKTGLVLGKIISWIIKTVLIAAGFMVTKDAVNALTGHKDVPPSSNGLPTLEHVLQTSTPIKSTQTKFKVNPSYQEEKLNMGTGWIEMVSPSNIGNNIIQWTQFIYPDLDGQDSLIESNSAFQKTVDTIQEYNSTNKSNITFMPKMFTSKKKVVDLFIDSLANQSGNQVKNLKSPNNLLPEQQKEVVSA